MNKLIKILSFTLLLTNDIGAQKKPSADLGNGSYRNPIIHADYSDPDAVRVGDDYYMISSSFNAAPALPILHSRDLVNWTLIGHVLQKQLPLEHFFYVQHGGGVWAPSIRYHNNEFYIYYPDPDFGIYLTRAKNIRGPWSEPLLVAEGKGLIDPCPLWDDNGKTYLVHAFAGSRAGIKSVIVVGEMNREGTKMIGPTRLVYDGHANDPTIEGPKFYKRNNYYYIFAPAGGVSTGWQTVLRSRNVFGPYVRKVVLAQGSTSVNGPHQGAWVTTKTGEDWFLHFQDKDMYGRIVHLQPMKWVGDWPVIGEDPDQDGIGNPVSTYKKPNVGKTYPITTIASSDEFEGIEPGLQWQWQANPQAHWAFNLNGKLRLYSKELNENEGSLWQLPAMLTQKFAAEEFVATTKIDLHTRLDGEQAGLTVFGIDYAYISLLKRPRGNAISFGICQNADKNNMPAITLGESIGINEIYLRVTVTKGANCIFSYSLDGVQFKTIGSPFTARPGKWVGAKLGLFCTRPVKTNDAGYAEFDWFRVE